MVSAFLNLKSGAPFRGDFRVMDNEGGGVSVKNVEIKVIHFLHFCRGSKQKPLENERDSVDSFTLKDVGETTVLVT